MNRLINNKLSLTFSMLLIAAAVSFAQEKKLESFNVKKDVAIELNTSHTNIRFETWNKNKVEVEAFIKGEGLSQQEQKELLNKWNVSITGNSDKVTVSTNPVGTFPMGEVHLQLGELQEIGPMVLEMIGPMLENMPMTPLPDDFMKEMGGIKFDFKQYQENSEEYMKAWEEKMEEKFGKDFEVKMEAWAEKYEKDAEKMEKEMEAWGEKFGKDFEIKMEAWGENFGKQMEAWGEDFAKQWEEGQSAKGFKSKPGVKRTIIIRMPKDATLDLNVRHGELKLAESVQNLKANLNYTKLTANSIDGAKTSIIAAYAPVTVSNWVKGELQLNFVDDCKIDKIGIIHLNANSSDVVINKINEKAFINGSFGMLQLKEIGAGFTAIDLVLENSEANVKLPNGAFDFFYSGSKSKLKYPSSLQVTETKSRDKELIKGFSSAKNSPKTITINARFSDVVFQ